MPTPIGSTNFSTWSYVSSDGEIQNVSLLGQSYKFGNGSFSKSVGFDTNLEFDENGIRKTVAPILQLKCSQTIYENDSFSLSVGARGRFTPNYTQARGIVSATFPINERVKLYEEAYGTAKFKSDETSLTASLCSGVKYKASNNLDVGFEIQKNFDLQNPTFNGWKNGQWLANIGVTYSF